MLLPKREVGDQDRRQRVTGERLVEAATRHGEVLYVVPGSPLVLERTVRSLRDDARVETTILPLP